jgi:hypothetical protein
MNSKLALNITKILLILLGAAGLGGYSYTNHESSKRGYEVLAAAVNQSVLGRLDTMEKRLDALEQRPASQPASLPFIKTLILPGPSKDPYGDLRKELGAMKAAKAVVRPATKAPPAPTKATPPPAMKKAPMRVPAKLKDAQ